MASWTGTTKSSAPTWLTGVETSADFLLNEAGDYILQEDGSRILLENNSQETWAGTSKSSAPTWTNISEN